jgi:hypothetical protein
MLATCTFDVVSTLDGFASFEGGDRGPFWGKAGHELLDHRLGAYRRSSGWFSGRTRPGSSWSCWARAPSQKRRTR